MIHVVITLYCHFDTSASASSSQQSLVRLFLTSGNMSAPRHLVIVALLVLLACAQGRFSTATPSRPLPDLARMSLAKIKAELAARGVDCPQCTKKVDFVERLLFSWHVPAPATTPLPEDRAFVRNARAVLSETTLESSARDSQRRAAADQRLNEIDAPVGASPLSHSTPTAQPTRHHNEL